MDWAHWGVAPIYIVPGSHLVPTHFYKLDNVCTLTRVGDYRKIPSFGLGSSLDLILVFSYTPLLLSRYRLNI